MESRSPQLTQQLPGLSRQLISIVIAAVVTGAPLACPEELTVRVVDADEQPVPSAAVYLISRSPPSRNDRDGTQPLPPALVRCTAEKMNPSELVVSPGQWIVGVAVDDADHWFNFIEPDAPQPGGLIDSRSDWTTLSRLAKVPGSVLLLRDDYHPKPICRIIVSNTGIVAYTNSAGIAALPASKVCDESDLHVHSQHHAKARFKIRELRQYSGSSPFVVKLEE